MDEVYDLVVIGADPAGEVAAELAAAFGRRVLVVERDKPGGPTHFPGVPFDGPDVYDPDPVYSLRTVRDDIVVVGAGQT
jgi:pyruvate/2-oxoglutarate dehydrogenase complex dihydrolipoamide dehydrogenase (E3) component